MRTLDERMPYLTITRPKTVHNIVRIPYYRTYHLLHPNILLVQLRPGPGISFSTVTVYCPSLTEVDGCFAEREVREATRPVT